MRYNKFGNKKTVIDGYTFDSKGEAKRFKELVLLGRQGLISDLVLQPVYILQNSFKRHNKTIRKIEYVADFRYKQNGVIVVEDFKGFKTDVYKLKKKMLLFKYPELDFREIY